MVDVETITIGTAEFEVYGTQAEVKAYLAGRLGTDAFDNASGTDRKKAHVQATRAIDRERWNGEKASESQGTAFPRSNLYDCDGTLLANDEVPVGVFNATCELVLIILGDASATAKTNDLSNVKAVGAGSARVEFFAPSVVNAGGGAPFPTEVWKWLRCFAGGAGAASAGGYRGGAGNTSEFDDYPSNYGLTRGY